MGSLHIPSDFYVYLHRKKTNGEVFYVGKGCGYRAWQETPKTRSKFWWRVRTRHGLIVEVVASGLQEWYAHELEVELIALYGRRDLMEGTLVNMTDGGEGARTNNPELANRRSKMMLGNSYLLGHVHSHSTRLKISAANKGKAKPSGFAEKISKALSGKAKSESHKSNLSKSAKLRSKEPYTEAHGKLKRPLRCSNGMVFAGTSDARDWLYSEGHMKVYSKPSNIAACALGKPRWKTAYGFSWKYIDLEAKS